MASEYQHNTYEQVRDYMSAAFTLVNELELDDELRVPAFKKAVDLLAAKQVTLTQGDMGAVPLPAMAIPRGKGH